MNRALAGFVGGLSLVGLLAVAGLLWPVASQHLGWRGNEPVETTGPVFDRTRLHADLADKGFALGNEAHLRIYKREHTAELWLRKAGDTRFTLFRSFEICRYSGELGPKLAEGDRQAPEGFYRVAGRQLNPHSRHHLAFNLGFPNAFDAGHGRTGSFLMVHGGCTSTGCYAMTDAQIDQIYAVVEAALAGGQREVDVSIFPFRMTETALQLESRHRWASFWRNLKQGAELFERHGVPPRVASCNGAYVFGGDAVGEGCTPITGWV